MSEHDGERTREEAEQEIILLAERIVELMRQKETLTKALSLAEYVSRKDSLTADERLSSVRTVICNAIAALPDETGK